MSPTTNNGGRRTRGQPDFGWLPRTTNRFKSLARTIRSEADLFIVEALSFEKRIGQHLDGTSFRLDADRISAKRIVLVRCGPEMFGERGYERRWAFGSVYVWRSHLVVLRQHHAQPGLLLRGLPTRDVLASHCVPGVPARAADVDRRSQAL